MIIVLKPWTRKDKDILKDLCNHIDRSHLSDRIPSPYTEQDAIWWLTMVEEHEGKDGIFRAIEVDGKIVGNISVEQDGDVYKKDAAIGYFLSSDLWGKGIMSEAVNEICKIAFQKLDILRISGLVYSKNIASQKVLEKNNFVLEGVKKCAVLKNGQIDDLCIYGKLKN